MYKVVLIEDEINIRENIREKFPWADNQLVFAGEASDGETALQLIEDVNPQIIITDIKMSFLNGLDLSRIVLKQMPWVKIIIMTGHDDFDLAQQALKIGVSDYMLKPVGLEELRTSLRAIVKKIEEEAEHLQNIEKLQTKMAINKQFLKDEFFCNLVAGALNVSEILETSAELGISIQAKAYATIVLLLESDANPSFSKSEELIKAGAIINTLQAEDVLVARMSLKQYVLILKGSGEDSLQNDCYRISQSVKRELENKTHVMASLYIGGTKTRLEDIHDSYEEAQKTASLSYLFGKNKVLGLEDTRMVNPYQGTTIPFERTEIAKFLRLGASEEVDAFIAAQVKRFDTFPSTLFHLMLIRFNLLYEVGSFLEEIGFYSEGLDAHKQLGVLVFEYAEEFSQAQIIEKAYELFVFALQHREERKVQKYERLISQAKMYIHENYHRRTLQLSDVASHVNLSASHLSTVFAQETGKNYTDYVCEVRIAKAKELLATSSLRSAEIAYEVGYNDPHYFYNVFKKMTGMTSSTYRDTVTKPAGGV